MSDVCTERDCGAPVVHGTPICHHEQWKPTEVEVARAREARAHVHAETCYRGLLDPPGCRMCPTGRGLVDALRVLDANPRDARGARRALHDVVCMSSCPPEDSEHADRTQAKTVASLRRFHADNRMEPRAS